MIKGHPGDNEIAGAIGNLQIYSHVSTEDSLVFSARNFKVCGIYRKSDKASATKRHTS